MLVMLMKSKDQILTKMEFESLWGVANNATGHTAEVEIEKAFRDGQL